MVAAQDSMRPLLDGARMGELATKMWEFARPEQITELGALKVFKLSARGNSKRDEEEARRRLDNEISALSPGFDGLPKLLDSSAAEGWLVTEYFPRGTLERSPEQYKGDPPRALKAFRSLVRTVELLHDKGYVHRDIKPANIFIREDDKLVLGDFGIVFIPAAAERLTQTQERVGPLDYMPPWGDLGQRLENVRPCFDVYMLGKVLWCMVAGRLKLPREYHRRSGFNLEELFPETPGMSALNDILDDCLVEDEATCLPTAGSLEPLVDRQIKMLEVGGDLSPNGLRRCRVCGEGTYVPSPDHVMGQSLYDLHSRPDGAMYTEFFVCNNCGHLQQFRTKKRI
jgi:serine/threonine protein kinase